jgi:hypothetical protein
LAVVEARTALQRGLTTSGKQADLSKHALGHVLVSVPSVLGFLSTREARHLRRGDKALRSIVAEYPWCDLSTTIDHRVIEWRTSFPAAVGCSLPFPIRGRGPIPKAVIPQMTGLTSFRSISQHFFSHPVLIDELLEFKSSLPDLSVLIFEKHVDAPAHASSLAAPSWGDFSGLRELSLGFNIPSSLPVAFFGHLGSLRKLSLSSYSEETNMPTFAPGLEAMPHLEDISFRGLAWAALLVPSGLVALTRLAVLSLNELHLPPNTLACTAPSLRTLWLMRCSLVNNAAFTHPNLSSLLELKLEARYDASHTALTADAFVGLSSLETLEVTNGYFGLCSQRLLEVLGSMNVLKRLLLPDFDGIDGMLSMLRGCPLVEIGLAHAWNTRRLFCATAFTQLPKTLRRFGCHAAHDSGVFWTALTTVTVR